MPKKRQPKQIWNITREKVYIRDNGKCQHCGQGVTLNTCHIDHLISGKLGTNKLTNLRTLCRRCHVLREDKRHRGLVSKALKDGIIPFNWRELVWSD